VDGLGTGGKELFVSTTDQQLLAEGVVVPWVVYGPRRDHGHDLAMDPVEVYRDMATARGRKVLAGQRMFAYFDQRLRDDRGGGRPVGERDSVGAPGPSRGGGSFRRWGVGAAPPGASASRTW
jgi:hypothetical protein